MLRFREIFPITYNSNSLMDIAIPFVPSKWEGTRTASIVTTYTSYRPIRVNLTWAPLVGTSQTGSCTVGTVFDGTRLTMPTRNDAIRSLSITNGGFTTSMWKPHYSRVFLGTNLRANTYPSNEISADDIPFWICTTLSEDAPAATCGMLVVTGLIALHNPSNCLQPPITMRNLTGEIVDQSTEEEDEPFNLMRIPVTNQLLLPADADLWFAPTNYLHNATNQVITQLLSPIILHYLGSDESYHNFRIDKDFAPQVIVGVIGGLVANFLLREPQSQ